MAQKAEAFVGYSYVDFNAAGTTTNLNGGVGSVAYNFTKHIGAVGEVAGYDVSAGSGGSAITYLFGPKVSMHVGKFVPFGQVLFGGIHASGGGSSTDSFAMTFGGGVDYNVTHHFAVRLGQLEDLYTQLGSGSQNSFRYSGGVVFKL
jgi:opacity protein-like surface antigen